MMEAESLFTRGGSPDDQGMCGGETHNETKAQQYLNSFLLKSSPCSSIDLWYIKAHFLADQYLPNFPFITPRQE